MGFFDAFKNQWIDIIRWEDPSANALVHKFEQSLDQIENNSSLIVDPWMGAIFIRNGKIEAIEKESGKWTLETENTPFITALKNIMSGFETHDKAQVFFIKTQQIANQKWGTPNTITYVDPTYNFPVELRAFGNFSFQISDIENFWINYVANQAEVSTDSIRILMLDRLVGKIGQIFAEKKISYNDIDAHMHTISQELLEATKEDFAAIGLTLTDFRIEDTNFSETTQGFIEKIINKKADVAAIDSLKDVDQSGLKNYQTIEQLNIAKKAAESGGSAGEMVGAGVGMAMGMQMGNAMNMQTPAPQTSSTPSLEERLEKLNSLLKKELISKEDFDKRKNKILEEI